MKIPFEKMHGLGNDFVLLDQRETDYALSAAQYSNIASRRFGVGCDQVLIIEPSSVPQAAGRYRVINSDGSPAEHCGNGIRCVASYLRARGDVDAAHCFIEVDGESYELAFVDDDYVRVDMGKPRVRPQDVPIAAKDYALRYDITVGDAAYQFGCVSMGNPHAVTFVDDVATAPVAEVGEQLQHHSFFPAKVNCGFGEIINRGTLKLRVYERGAGLTMACGTGACAAVVVGVQWRVLDHSVDVALPGGTLKVEWTGKIEESVWMTGPAAHVFTGIIDV